jgi:uncharacterized protein YbjT (DUF2867 family)
MTRTILVAGANGWLGQKVAQALVARGARPRLMMRGGTEHKSAVAVLDALGGSADIVSADLGNAASLANVVEGVDAIASVVQGGPDVIIDGQVALANAAKAAGVKRIFPSDFSMRLDNYTVDEHVFLGLRVEADRQIAALGLPQTNVTNGAFTEMLDQPFFGLLDKAANEVRYWGSFDQPYQFTHTDDVAATVAAAVLDPETPEGPLEIASDTLSPAQLAEVASRVFDRAFTPVLLGSLEALDAEIEARRSGSNNPGDYAGLQYNRMMANGRGTLLNPRLPHANGDAAITVEAFLRSLA